MVGQVLRDVEVELGPAPTRFRLRTELTDELPPEDHVSAVHGLVFAGDHIVLARHVTRSWTIPGGHVDPGETIDEALRRECLEEAGVTIGAPTLLAVERIDRLSGPADTSRRVYPEPAFQLFFVAAAVGPLVEPTALDECTESRLFAPDEARAAEGWVQDGRPLYEAALAWALDHLCSGCDFVYDESAHAGAAEAIRSGVVEVSAALRANPTAAVRRVPERWSPLEYGCHLRDVLLTQRERTIRALVAPPGEPPPSPPMHRDERVAIEAYAESTAADVARQLEDAATLFTNVLDRLDDEGWSRKLVYNYPMEQERSLRWVAVHTLHEVHHHLGDVLRPA